MNLRLPALLMAAILGSSSDGTPWPGFRGPAMDGLALGARRLESLLDEYGDATVAEALAELKRRAAAQFRALIGELMPGRYAAEDFLVGPLLAVALIPFLVAVAWLSRHEQERFRARWRTAASA